MPKLSIIIPVYNAEKYLKQCLDSIINQAFEDFEIILINDGSQDKTEEIIKVYLNKDIRIKAFYQKNAGASVARNTGIDKAKGEFITFIDADDWIEEDYLISFFENEKNPKNSLVMTGYSRQDKYNKFHPESLPKGVYKKQDFSNLFFNINLISKWPYTIGKLYDRNIVHKNNLFFEPSVTYGEDLIFFLNYLLYIETIILNSKSSYFYRYTPTSLSQSKHSYQSELKRMHMVQELIKKLKTNYDLKIKTINQALEHVSYYYYRYLSSLYFYEKKKENRLKSLKYSKENNSFIVYYKYAKNKPRIYSYFCKLMNKEYYNYANSLLTIWFRYLNLRKRK